MPPIVEKVLSSSGQPLDSATREHMESRFGHDLGDVRVHTDSRASESARAISAKAYTLGNNVVFGAGQYAPATRGGSVLLAHELVHVLQQRGSRLTNIGTESGSSWNTTSVMQRAFEPVIMRRHLFTSTMNICRRLLKSRVFHVADGGLRVTANAAYERSGTPACSSADYHMTLEQQGFLFDSGYGTCDFPQGEVFSRQWTSLPKDDYYLTIWTNNTNPYCCLVGDIVVEQLSNLEGESCTQPPPGPLEILHTALDVAGLVPALGAVPDAINAGIYLIEGNWTEAGLSAVAIIPIFGDAATIGKHGSRIVVRVSGEGVERVGRQGIEAGLRDARASRRAATSTRRVDPDVDDLVERGILEEASTTTAPARRPRPARPAVRGRAEAARVDFNRVRDGYARHLGVPPGGQVHHAIELQALDRYPGVFSASDLNAFRNMRGIGTEVANRRQLHNSKVREMWDRHYRQLDQEIAERGLIPGTQGYNDYVRRYLGDARDEIDYVVGQFFTEVRSGLTWQRVAP